MDIQKTNQGNQQVVTYQPPALHKQLRATILALGMAQDNKDAAQHKDAKMVLFSHKAELMPAGKPAYLEMIKYPTITQVIADIGEPATLLMISILIKDFCASVNVSRNMNEDQILEAALMLLNERGNFRMEDYTVMFAMASRGELVKIYERVDLSVITEIADAYYARRRDEKIAMEEADIERQEAQPLIPKSWETPEARKSMRDMHHSVEGIAAGFSDMKQAMQSLTDTQNFKDGKAGNLDGQTGG